jgi:spore maturation protein CgeB
VSDGLRIAFFGSSIVSSYWNGACTYYRGIVRALSERGHHVTFYEPDAYERQQHRDIDDPPWAEVVVYEPTAGAAAQAVASAESADVVIKASGVGVCDRELERLVLDLRGDSLRIWWDVDAPATLSALEAGEDPALREAVPAFDLVLTYGGGDPVVSRYRRLGARSCVPIYNALDPETHHPQPPREDLRCDLSFLGNRMPDREARVREFFLGAASRLPASRFVLGGSGWTAAELTDNVRLLGHVPTRMHNVFNASSLAVLNVSRESMAANGHSPATRVFEAAGAGACLITDRWDGIEAFLEPGREVLVADDGAGVAELLSGLAPERAAAIGSAALERVLSEHTYSRRAQQVEEVLGEKLSGRPDLEAAR